MPHIDPWEAAGPHERASLAATCDYCSSPMIGDNLACDACQAKIDTAHAATDAAAFNDVREQQRLQDEADLRYEYNQPEYDEF
jgi:hypothetical protein